MPKLNIEIIVGLPPNIDAIKKVLRPSINTVFTYGTKIYNPNGQPMSDDLIAHETTHVQQQMRITPEKWWAEYLSSPTFRLKEELAAYQVQWAKAQERNRDYRRGLLNHISKDLAGPMYGKIVSKEKAKELITA